jgi:hypothetical protein
MESQKNGWSKLTMTVSKIKAFCSQPIFHMFLRLETPRISIFGTF